MNIDSMKEFLVQQPYRLTICRNSLGIHQQRILCKIVVALQPQMGFDVDFLNTADLLVKINVKGLTRGGNVKPLREALNGLMTKIIRMMHWLPEKKRTLEIGTPLVQEYQYLTGSSEITLKISGYLLPQLLDLKKGYTKYSVDVAFNTSSPYTFKLYQHMAHFRDKKEIQCNLDSLRSFLEIEDKYPEPYSIKQQILVPAMRDLKAKGDVWFSIADRVKDGRRLIGWKFNIHTKPGLKALPPKTLEKPQVPSDPESARMFDRLTKRHGLSSPQALVALSSISMADLNKTLYNLNNDRDKIRNMGAKTVTVLQDKYHVSLSRGPRRRK